MTEEQQREFHICVVGCGERKHVLQKSLFVHLMNFIMVVRISWSIVWVSPVIDHLLQKFAAGRTQTGDFSLVLLQADGKADEGSDVGDQDGNVGLVDGVDLHQDVHQGHLLFVHVTVSSCPLALVVPHVHNLDDNVNHPNHDGIVEEHQIEYSALPQ